MSVIALCYFKIYPSVSTWKTDDINSILNHGDIQYHASYKQMKIDGRSPQRKYLMMSEVYPYAKICKTLFRLDIDVFGYLNVEKDILGSQSLETSLNRFFKENRNQCGLFVCNVYSFAIIQTSYSFFLLNSRATSYAGEPMSSNDKESAACLMEMFTIKCLINHLLVACSQEHMIFDDVDRFQPEYYLVQLNIEEKKFGKDVLTRKKVNRHLLLADINRGGIKRKPKSTITESSYISVPKAQLVRHVH